MAISHRNCGDGDAVTGAEGLDDGEGFAVVGVGGVVEVAIFAVGAGPVTPAQ